MTRDQYKRLLKVTTLPLLFAGLIISLVTDPPSYTKVICESVGHCWTESKDGGWFSYEGVKARSGDLFDVYTREYDENRFPRVSVSAAGLDIPNAQVVGVSTYAGTSEQYGSPFSHLKGMIGQRIDLQMGVGNRDDEERLLNPLGCNELNLVQSPRLFEAGLCGVPNGVVRVQFVLDEGDSQVLHKMRENIEDRASDGRENLITHHAFLIPSLLMLFLVCSGVVWVARRATLYVARG